MTNKEAARTLLYSLYRDSNGYISITHNNTDAFLDALCLAICALMREEEVGMGKHEEKPKIPKLHDAISDPPKEPGLYFGLSVNSVWECWYENGKWSLFCNPNHGPELDILYWLYPIRNGVLDT